jgi:hypothetical protein
MKFPRETSAATMGATAAHWGYLGDRTRAAAEAESQGGVAMTQRPYRIQKKRNRDDRVQQKIALGTWEDEGGSVAEHATNTRVASTSDKRRST